MVYALKIAISISAYSSEPREKHREKALKLLEELDFLFSERISYYILGGYRGLMKYVTDFLVSRGRKVVMILPLEYEADDISEDVIKIRAGTTFTNRNVIMVRSGDVLLCLGGGLGSFTEVVNALSMGKLTIVLRNTGSLTDSLEGFMGKGVVDERKGGFLAFVDRGSEAVEIIQNRFASI